MTELENRLIASLTAQVEHTEQLAKQVNALSEQLASFDDFPEQLSTLEQHLAALEQRLDTLYGQQR